jgi:hypothetical protein
MSRLATASLAALLAATSACTYSDRHHDGHHGEGPSSNTPPIEEPVISATIDTGATLADIEPGRGAGAFVEYEGGGRWHVFTACDTELSDIGCEWDIIVSIAEGNELEGFDADRLEGSDYLEWESRLSVRLITSTTYDFDGFWVDATVGAPLRVDVYLDRRPAPKYIYWVGDGALHRGAPSNPIDLIPSAL